MHPLLGAGYAAAGILARAAASLLPPGGGKVRASIAARRGIAERYGAWAAHSRDPARRLLWMHAPSVGEGLQARPVLERLRITKPDLQLAYTFFSPSAAPLARGLDVDFTDYLPFDTTRDARQALHSLRPDVIAFSKLDVWPILVREASGRGVRIALVSATLPPDSSRLRGLAPALLRGTYSALDAVGAIADEDADRLVALGVRRQVITVTGDTRYDQVLARAGQRDRHRELLAAFADDRPTLVAGSTWPADERVLLPAMAMVLKETPDLRCIIAPHEPTPQHLHALERSAAAIGREAVRLSSGRVAEATIVLVDRVGVLGDLYAAADVAFVGGGFHAAGLHSVLEPAAFGVPVLYGPRHANSREASLLVRAGAARSVAGSPSLASELTRWLRDHTARSQAGKAARRFVEAGRGATARTLAMLEALLDA